MSRSNDKHASPEPEGKVITIGWQVIVLPILLIVVLVGGFYIGTSMAGSGEPEAVAVQPVATSPNTIVVNPGSVQSLTPQVIQIPTSDLLRFDPDVVYPLDRRPHALLGQPAPDFTAQLLGSDDPVSLSDYQGQPVLLDFWATWCPPCRVEMPWFEQAYQEYGDDGLVVLAVDVGEKVPAEMAEQTIKTFVDGMGLTFPILLEGEDLAIQRAYSVMGYPTAFLIDSEGTVVDFHQSMYPNFVTLESRLASILPEGAVEASGSAGDAGGEG